MKRFFELSFRPFFVLTGIGTALGGLNAFLPIWPAETVEKIPFVQECTIILQHWGIMLGLVGFTRLPISACITSRLILARTTFRPKRNES
jgi:hypothetical protein